MIYLAIYATLISSVVLYVSKLYLISIGEVIQTSTTTSSKNKMPGWAFNGHFDVSQDQDEVAICNMCGYSLKPGTNRKEKNCVVFYTFLFISKF